MTADGKIVKRGDTIYVEAIYRQSDKPLDTILLWKVERIVRNPYHVGYSTPEHGDIVTNNGTGNGWASYSGKGYTVQFSANLQAEQVTEREVVCPKVRKGIETRYHNGEWQKLLKSGWTLA